MKRGAGAGGEITRSPTNNPEAAARAARERCNRREMSVRWLWEQGTEALTLLVEPASCPVCRKGLYRNITFLTGGWARCARCSEVVHYSCLSGAKIFKRRPRICRDCKAGRVREGQKMPASPPKAPGPTIAPAITPSQPPALPHPPGIAPARPEPAKTGDGSAPPTDSGSAPISTSSA